VAKTDLGAMFGIVDCIRECKKHWNKTDMGCEIYMPKDT
jgi:DNA polymerase III alpha subunit